MWCKCPLRINYPRDLSINCLSLQYLLDYIIRSDHPCLCGLYMNITSSTCEHTYCLWKRTWILCLELSGLRSHVNTRFKGRVHPNINSVINYSPSCRSKPVRPLFIFGTQRPCIDSKRPYTIMVQKRSKEIGEIIHVTSRSTVILRSYENTFCAQKK